MKRPAQRMDGMFDILPKFRGGRFLCESMLSKDIVFAKQKNLCYTQKKHIF